MQLTKYSYSCSYQQLLEGASHELVLVDYSCCDSRRLPPGYDETQKDALFGVPN
jgi:hypothetical protein